MVKKVKLLKTHMCRELYRSNFGLTTSPLRTRTLIHLLLEFHNIFI